MTTIDEALQEAIAAFDRDEMKEGALWIISVNTALYPPDRRGDPLFRELGASMSGVMIHALTRWVREGRLSPEAVTLGGVSTLLEQSTSQSLPSGADGTGEDVLWPYLTSLMAQPAPATSVDLLERNSVGALLFNMGSESMYEPCMRRLLEHMPTWRPEGAAVDGLLELMIEDVERWRGGSL